ncbi:VOC family protein [Mesorhizobium sp. CO1-1-7]|uniref:Putative lactoylglutathione lyase n=1 Tax=Mesorhizobium australicum (strain HAMBI 3006 / LMG 24608 / WSM2073) TaxID=754035 RepID=L0KCB9_MESAW|nr:MULTISPECIES: VOC family protein [Mesorhizobium]MBZ9929745.1 VOC family protein [Mesorhizobium sp. BR1-1-5]AGB42942.1 putative lactoylglutathione lyase [Mesorhizobium australicum WSM2073]MBZ9697354.1 VOC family protein [Mesorhizobium sp. CO1-1-9]MBZ9723994.1 VOC family protein [Mesorhizobium sp. CO1-1-11]MBZ9748553.1 VOC family protein [Mesorhizobium sp. CO1-1-7]
MTKMIFINLPVRDLQAATNFYLAIGGTLNPQFSNDQASSVMFSDAIGVMLLTHQHYGQFTTRQIGDARRDSQMLIALTASSKDEVNATIEKGVAAGGRADPNPAQDLGFMFNRHIEDPDGNVWELLWMNPAAMQ